MENRVKCEIKLSKEELISMFQEKCQPFTFASYYDSKKTVYFSYRSNRIYLFQSSDGKAFPSSARFCGKIKEYPGYIYLSGKFDLPKLFVIGFKLPLLIFSVLLIYENFDKKFLFPFLLMLSIWFILVSVFKRIYLKVTSKGNLDVLNLLKSITTCCHINHKKTEEIK